MGRHGKAGRGGWEGGELRVRRAEEEAGAEEDGQSGSLRSAAG